MTLEDYREDMAACVRCSSCKWVPFNQMRSSRFSHNCPSINRFNFHSFSGSGRMNMGLSIMDGRSELTEKVSEVIYSCQLCGACDVTCKTYREIIDLTEVLLELRGKCVEDGQLLPEHMAAIDALKQENNMLGEPKAERGAWAEGLGLKDINREKVDVMLHAGCRFSYDKELWPALRGAVRLLLSAGLDVGVAGPEESCCGGRAYELGYRGEARNFAEDLQARVKASGASMLLTPCSDGFSAFRYLYPRMGVELAAEPVHLTQLLDRLIKQGKLRLRHPVDLKVTWHDPCHLGRMGEPYLPEWEGDKRQRLRCQSRTGKRGVYEEPRRVLEALPGLELREMERIREWSWCCGAGGGVIDAFPEFAAWTASERLQEALSTGAEALVTACPWCERVFRDAVAENDYNLKIFDLAELVLRSVEGDEGSGEEVPA
jgi:Fe-S oxidoreductase